MDTLAAMDLEAGESVIFEGHPSWRSILGYYLKGLVVVVLAGAIAAAVAEIADNKVHGSWIAIAAIAVLVVVIVIGYLRRIATTYTITTSRLTIRRGILSRSEQHSRVDRIQNVTTNQSVLQRLLRVGTVEFDTAAGEDDELKFAGVAAPHDVVEAIRQAQRESPSVAARTV
jgi:uncharacterized membrane protein YdbT with pleckstrin-like domain